MWSVAQVTYAMVETVVKGKILQVCFRTSYQDSLKYTICY